jgi:hypothetical protein
MTQNRRDGILEYLASTRYVRRLNVRKDLAEFTKSTIEWMLSTASAESLSRIDFVLLNSIQADCEILVSKAKSTIVADLSVFEFIMEINARCKSAEPEEGRPYWEATALGHASLCAEQHLPAMFCANLRRQARSAAETYLSSMDNFTEEFRIQILLVLLHEVYHALMHTPEFRTLALSNWSVIKRLLLMRLDKALTPREDVLGLLMPKLGLSRERLVGNMEDSRMVAASWIEQHSEEIICDYYAFDALTNMLPDSDPGLIILYFDTALRALELRKLINGVGQNLWSSTLQEESAGVIFRDPRLGARALLCYPIAWVALAVRGARLDEDRLIAKMTRFPVVRDRFATNVLSIREAFRLAFPVPVKQSIGLPWFDEHVRKLTLEMFDCAKVDGGDEECLCWIGKHGN